MANLTIPTGVSATFPSGVYQLETTDPVLGGASGISNQQAKQLGERTEWLKYRIDNPTAPDKALGTNTTDVANTKFVLANMGRYSGVRVCSISGGIGTTNTLSASDAGKLVYANPTNDAKVVVTLPATTAFPEGQFVSFTNGSNYVMQIDRAGSEVIRINGSVTKTVLYVMPGESIALVVIGTEWFPVQKEGNFDSVGEISFIPYYGFTVPTGFLELKGQLVNRADYPRLYDLINSYTLLGHLVSDASWSSDKAKFSTGDGSTTFRLPDLRGQFIRAFDNAAGIDSGRAFASTQADELKAHTHTYRGATITPTGSDPSSTGSTFTTGDTGSTGGTETRPKNMTYVAVIKY